MPVTFAGHTLKLTSGSFQDRARIMPGGMILGKAPWRRWRQAGPGRTARITGPWPAVRLCLLAACLLAAWSGGAAARTYPKIFGSIELPSKNLKKFPKWLAMIDRWQNGAVIVRAPFFGDRTRFSLLRIGAGGPVELAAWGQP